MAITKTRLKYTENFTTKNWKFSDKNSDIAAQNIDCVKFHLSVFGGEIFNIFEDRTSLEPPRRSNEYSQSINLAEIRKIMYTPVNPSFTV